jgi:hypothetical protein
VFFHCYAVNDHPAGPCDACGKPVEAPADLWEIARGALSERRPGDYPA